MKIGLTYTGNEEKHENYVKWLKAGEDIEVIKLSVEGGLAEDCDALVLSGGVDIHPSFYGGGLDYSPGIGKAGPLKWREDRDVFEKAALEKALALGRPVLGVCRGLQLINVCCGGSLVQDLGVKGDEAHQNMPEDKQHGVRIEQGSLLYGVAGEGGLANSAHHQGIDRLGEGLRVNCRAEDGVIEGIEWIEPGGRPFMLAVQWHPERMFVNGFRDRALYLNIRHRFIEEIKKSITIL